MRGFFGDLYHFGLKLAPTSEVIVNLLTAAQWDATLQIASIFVPVDRRGTESESDENKQDKYRLLKLAPFLEPKVFQIYLLLGVGIVKKNTFKVRKVEYVACVIFEVEPKKT